MIETKVTNASVMTYFGVVALLTILESISSLDLIPDMPGWLTVIITPVIPAAMTFLAGYASRHTPRRPARPTVDTDI